MDIEVEAYDECNTVIDIQRRSARIRRRAAAFVGLIGVQSNQFPRALDLARQFRAAGVTVAIGGFHVSGLHRHAARIAARPEGGAGASASCSMPAKPKAAWTCSCATCGRERRSRSTTTWTICRTWRPPRYPILPREMVDPRRRPLYELRRRPRLPVPVQLLHHHQRAGPQVALSHGRRRRRDRARQCRAGHHALLRHRRQFRPQQELGADPRPADRAARETGLPHPADAAGRHALPPHPGLHREGGAGGLQRRVHRAGEHQSRIADGREEAPEQDLGISRNVAGLAAAPR